MPDTRKGSDKEEIDKLYKDALETGGKPKKPTTPKDPKYTYTPAGSSKPPPRKIAFTGNEPENPTAQSESPSDTSASDSSDSEDVSVDKKEHKIIKIMANQNTFAPLKYAVEAVPFFDGQNIPLSYFIEGCEEAKSMLPNEAEPQFARIIRTRIVGEARRTIQDQNFDSVAALTAFLKQVYGLSKTVYQLQGELGSVYQKNDEDVVTYANRVKLLGKQILEAYKTWGNSPVDQSVKTSLEKDMSKCFIRGLKPEIEQRIERDLNVQETVADALRIERELRSITDLREGSTTSQSRNTLQTPETCQICYKVDIQPPNVGN